MTPEEISLNIDRLVLHGFSAVDRQRVADALHDELHRLLSDASTESSARTTVLRYVDAGRIAADTRSTPEVIGVQVARHVVSQINFNMGGASAFRHGGGS
ncbi:MAG: hypothetical protein OEW08_01230 [Gammaproteobacteria bacterium]|nr:hypothetical protein [Gammaproteobacteria bacterium]